jgi:hypothetical protein
MFGLGLGIGLGQNVAALSGGGGSYTPMSFPGLQGLYDPDQQTESADAALATFSDRSGNANHWSQASAPNRPILRYSVINGRKVLEFDGVNSVMSCATGLMNGATAGSWFALIKLDADPPANPGPVIDGFGASDSYHPYTDGHIYDGFGTSVRKTCGNPTPSLASWAIVGAISASGDYRFFVNDKSTPLFSTGTNTVSMGTGTRGLGTNTVTAGNQIKGQLAHLVIGNAAPSAGDLTNHWAWINTQFGTSF